MEMYRKRMVTVQLEIKGWKIMFASIQMQSKRFTLLRVHVTWILPRLDQDIIYDLIPTVQCAGAVSNSLPKKKEQQQFWFENLMLLLQVVLSANVNADSCDALCVQPSCLGDAPVFQPKFRNIHLDARYTVITLFHSAIFGFCVKTLISWQVVFRVSLLLLWRRPSEMYTCLSHWHGKPPTCMPLKLSAECEFGQRKLPSCADVTF